jgi:hypothetical protein
MAKSTIEAICVLLQDRSLILPPPSALMQPARPGTSFPLTQEVQARKYSQLTM